MIWQSILCSIDSFFVAMGLGILGAPARCRTKIALCFTAFDLFGSLLGATLHTWARPSTGAVDLFLLALLLTAAAGIILLNCDRRARLFIAVPLLLSLDNVVAGVKHTDLAQLPQALLLAAMSSGLLAMGGLWAGRQIGAIAPWHFTRYRKYFAMVSVIFLADVFS